MMLDGGGVAGRWRGRVLAGRAGGKCACLGGSAEVHGGGCGTRHGLEIAYIAV